MLPQRLHRSLQFRHHVSVDPHTSQASDCGESDGGGAGSAMLRIYESGTRRAGAADYSASSPSFSADRT